MAEFTAFVSGVDSEDKVLERRLHVFDKDANETVFVFNSSDTQLKATLDAEAAPGSCYLVDLNAAGESPASVAVPLVPDVQPPPPPPQQVPKQPTILSVQWEANPDNFRSPSSNGAKVVDRRYV